MRVIATVQSEGNDPVDMQWCKDGEDVDVLLSVAQILRHAKDETPWSPQVLAIRVEF